MVRSEITVGVPLISPVDESKERPNGRVGEIDQVKIVPPPTVGVVAVIGESLVSTNEFGLYEIVGIMSFTVMSIVVVALPPVFVAVIV